MLKEYRICMPMTVEEYHIGQLYMIARHSAEQSDDSGEGVETIVNEPCDDEEHGKGQYAEKRIHLTSKLPSWIRSYMPRFIYITEKSWNYYPYTVTEYTCSIIPKFSVKIWTRYENNDGSNDNVHTGTGPEEPITTDYVDIATDPVRPHQYKEVEDPSKLVSSKTGRGRLTEGWRHTTTPIMCSYKLVHVSFAVFGLQTRVEDFVQREIRNVNVLAHRQAFAWLDEWYGWDIADVRAYEEKMQQATNDKIRHGQKEQEGSVPDMVEDVTNSTDEALPRSHSTGHANLLQSRSLSTGGGKSLPRSKSSPSTKSGPSSPVEGPPSKQGYLAGFFKWS